MGESILKALKSLKMAAMMKMVIKRLNLDQTQNFVVFLELLCFTGGEYYIKKAYKHIPSSLKAYP